MSITTSADTRPFGVGEKNALTATRLAFGQRAD
jgi:hypothetical protein